MWQWRCLDSPMKHKAEQLGLSNLAIASSGYAPDIGAANPTGSFKDLEAVPSMSYYPEHSIEAFVLASAGNTARTFAQGAIQLGSPVVIVVPERATDRLWIPCNQTDTVRPVDLEGCDDYAVAIHTASSIGRVLNIANEGGARNDQRGSRWIGASKCGGKCGIHTRPLKVS